jgi:hypothetical protein
MKEITSLFDSLYNKFLLRDVFAKITPGLIVIFAALYFFQGSVKKIICLLGNLSFWQWFLLPLAWIMGFFLQHLGLMFKWLKDPTYTLWKSEEEKDKKKLAERFDKKVYISIRNDNEFCKLLERTIIIKETCGNASMALMFAGVFYLSGQVRALIVRKTNVSFWQWIVELLIVLIVLSISICVLRKSHEFQSVREELLRDSYEK